MAGYMTGNAAGHQSLGCLSWIGLLPLMYIIKKHNAVRALAEGAAWGIGFIAAGWLSGNPGAYLWQTAPLVIGASAVYTFLCAAVNRRIGFNPLIIALLWLGVEGVLGYSGADSITINPDNNNTFIIKILGGLLGYQVVGFIFVLAGATLFTLAGLVDIKITGLPGLTIYQFLRERPLITHITICPTILLLDSLQPRAPPL